MFLRADLADALKPFLFRLTPSAKVFKMPAPGDVVRRMLRRDLEAADIPYVDEVGRYADFHALRHSFITNLGRSGAHAKTAQDLARHSTPLLTARYTHGFKGDEMAAVNALPDLAHPGDESAAATGTDGKAAGDSVLASCLAHQQRPRETSVDSSGRKGKAVGGEADRLQVPASAGDTALLGQKRRGRDSNPRYREYPVRRFSKPLP